MEIIRFYSNGRQGIEYLAKYLCEQDGGAERINTLTQPLMAGLEDADEDAVYAAMNTRIVKLDADLQKAGFQRLPTLTEKDHDAECKNVYDLVMNPDEKSITLVTYEIKPTEDPVTPYNKVLVGKLILAGQSPVN